MDLDPYDTPTIILPPPSSAQRYDAVDLDPYGTPSMLLDSAVQSVGEGGILMVTATGMGFEGRAATGRVSGGALCRGGWHPDGDGRRWRGGEGRRGCWMKG